MTIADFYLESQSEIFWLSDVMVNVQILLYVSKWIQNSGKQLVVNALRRQLFVFELQSLKIINIYNVYDTMFNMKKIVWISEILQ